MKGFRYRDLACVLFLLAIPGAALPLPCHRPLSPPSAPVSVAPPR